MKYKVLFQDRIHSRTVEAENHYEAAAKAQKEENRLKKQKAMIVISVTAIKNFLLLVGFFVLCSFQTQEQPHTKLTFAVIIALLAGLWEVVVRVIPTVSNYSWIAKIIDILVWISDFLNRKKVKK